MEEYINILQNILAKDVIEVSPNYLNTYFEVIDKHGLLKSLNNDGAWNQAFGEIENNYKINKAQVIYKPDMVADFIKIISAIIGAKEQEKKVELFPLIIYLDQANILRQYLIDSEFFGGMDGRIASILKAIGTSFDKGDASSLHWESEYLDNYQKGIKNKEIKKIYSFILAYERGGRFLSNSFIDFMVFVLCQISNEKLINILNQKEDVLTIIRFIGSLPPDKKLKIAAASNNKILKFEILREVFYFEKNILDLENKILVKEIIINFSEDISFWKQFLIFYLEFPLRSPQLFELLGAALNQLSEKELEPFVDNIKIDIYISNECKSALNSCFFTIENKSIQRFISKRIFERWDEFIENNDKYTNSIIATNVIDIIIFYVDNFLDDRQIIKAIDLSIGSIKELDNEWFESEMKQISSFYKSMSKLFIYAFSANTRAIDRKILIQDICETNHILKHENHHDKKTTKALFSEFILTS